MYKKKNSFITESKQAADGPSHTKEGLVTFFFTCPFSMCMFRYSPFTLCPCIRIPELLLGRASKTTSNFRPKLKDSSVGRKISYSSVGYVISIPTLMMGMDLCRLYASKSDLLFLLCFKTYISFENMFVIVN